MIKIRKSEDRGHFNHGWLDSYHSFSFARYHDPNHVSFRSLRVLNEDRVRPGGAFGDHPHRNMEIISYILSGELTHGDSMKHTSTIGRGEVQRMTAGRGVVHSEANTSESEPVHFFQIWFFPEKNGLDPGYEQKHFEDEAKLNRLCLIASPGGQSNSLVIHQDVSLYASILDSGRTLDYRIAPTRHAWIQVASGRITANGHSLGAGDGAAISEEEQITISAESKSEFLLIDMA